MTRRDEQTLAGLVTGLAVIAHAERRLAPTRAAVRDAAQRFGDAPPTLLDRTLKKAARQPYYTASTETLAGVLESSDSATRRDRLLLYGRSFSDPVSQALDWLGFEPALAQLDVDIGPFLSAALTPGNADPWLGLDQLWDTKRLLTLEVRPEIAELMASVAVPDHSAPAVGALIDPSCGNGSVLAAAARRVSVTARIVGAEAGTLSAGIASARLILSDRVADIHVRPGSDEPWRVQHAADVVVCAPSEGHVRPTKARLADWLDLREQVEARTLPPLPDLPSSRAAIPVVQAITSMRTRDEGGARGALLLVAGWMFRGGHHGALRTWLARTGWVDSVVLLDSSVWLNSSVMARLIVLDNRRAPDAPIRVIDARGCIEGALHRGGRFDLDRIMARVAQPDSGQIRLITADEFAEPRSLMHLFAPAPEQTFEALQHALQAFDTVARSANEPRDPELPAALRGALRELNARIAEHEDALDALTDEPSLVEPGPADGE